jgi:hypothetical protein
MVIDIFLELQEIKKPDRDKGGTPWGSTTPRELYKKITQLIDKVNPDSVSKVIEENGELMVMYHRT